MEGGRGWHHRTHECPRGFMAGPQRRPHKRLDRRLEEVAKAVTVGYECH